MKDFKIRIAGTAGQGVISSGDILSYAVARKGFYVTTYRSFPSEIRGDGKCFYQLRISEERAHTTGETADVFISLDGAVDDKLLRKINNGGILIVDSDIFEEKLDNYTNFAKYLLPLSTMAKQVGSERSKNILALGVLAALIDNLNLKEQIILDMKKRYANKSKEVIESNVKAFEFGFEYGSKTLVREDNLAQIEMQTSGAKLIMSGNEAIGLAALVAGCRFFAGYPITPATEVMEWLAKESPKVGGKMVQCEDEIAAISAVIGASYGGKKAMTATSGPGLSLMQEAIGLASMAELPIVIANVMRGGPSTGIPTKTEQSDLFAAMYGTHGDCPKIVLAPMNVEDCFKQTLNAFNYAEKYQVPVILLSDATLGPRRECVDLIDFDHVEIINRETAILSVDEEKYCRYKDTPSGISPVSAPGDSGLAYVATGLEHTEDSSPTTEGANHKKMMEKRFRKLQTASSEFPHARFIGNNEAKIGIVSWGSTMGAVIEAVEAALAAGADVEAVCPRALYPMPTQWIKRFVSGKEVIINIEANYNAQLKSVIIERCNNFNRSVKTIEFLKYSGQPFSAEEIFYKIMEVNSVFEQEHSIGTNRPVF